MNLPVLLMIRQRPISRISIALENRLDIDDWSAVDCFQPLHFEPAIVIDAQDLCAMHSDRVGPIRRTRGKHSHQGILLIASRMHLEDRALRLMKPRKYPDVLSRFNAVEPPDKIRMDLQPRIGSALPSLVRSACTFLESGAHIADREEVEALWNIHSGLQEQGGQINRSNLPINFIKPCRSVLTGVVFASAKVSGSLSCPCRLTQKLYGYQA